MSNLTKRAVAVLATLMMTIGLAAAISSSATAATGGTSAKESNTSTVQTNGRQARRLYYGALSLNVRDGSGGYAYDYRTKAKARAVAQNRCRAKANYPNYCRKVVWVRNGCAAIAVRVKNRRIVEYRWGAAFTKKKAIAQAKRKVGANARVHSWVCTTRYR